MKRLTKSLLAIIVLCVSVANTYAQTDSIADQEPEKKAKAIEKADTYFENKEYSFAVVQYKKAYSKTKDRKAKAENLFRTGECYRLLGECKLAEGSYKRAYKMKYGAIAQLRYAEMIKCQGEYEDAIIEFTAFRTEVPDDPRGENGIAACKMALDNMANPTRYLVTNMKSLNTKARDYAAAYAAKRADDYGELYFVSSREGSSGKKESGITGQNFPDMYSTVAERKAKRGRNKTASAGVENLNFSEPFLLSEMVNSKHSEGPMTFDSRRKTLYFTRCESQKNQALGCAIWMTKKMGQDWQEPEKLVLSEDSSKSVGHPS